MTKRRHRIFSGFVGLALFGFLAAVDVALADPNSPYAGFKVPPLPISAEQPYQRKEIRVLDSTMAYVEGGSGDPILFLHGVPTSSYLWRNVMPHLEQQGRVIALDMIGFGDSEKPHEELSFEKQYSYLVAFIDALQLERATLVMHDWGSALGLHYARLNTDRIKAIVTMEAILAPVMPADSYQALKPGSAKFFKRVRDPVNGRSLIVEDNYFIEVALPGAIVRPLSDAVHDKYRRPFQTRKSRNSLHLWPNEMPIAGSPAHTFEIVTAYNKWLEETDMPWLFLYASPGSLTPPKAADYWAERGRNIEVVYIGTGLHFVQEDQPYAIGRALSDWYRRLSQE